MSVLSIQTRRIDGLTEATTAEDEDLLLIRKADGTGTRNIKKKNLMPETGVGNIKELKTKDKTSVVKAVNELSEAIGDPGTISNYKSNLISRYDGKRDLASLTAKELCLHYQTLVNLSDGQNKLERKITKITGRGAGFHNSIYGGHWLQDGLTNERVQAIRDGDFGDMFIGDTIGDFIIAHFDYFYNRYSPSSEVFSRHHIVLIPQTTNGDTFQYGLYGDLKCYAYSPIRSQGERSYNIQSILKNAKLYDHYCTMERIMIKNDEAKRTAICGAVEKCHVECMSAKMIFGFDPDCGTNYRVDTASETQFAIFRLAPERIRAGEPYWLTNTWDENRSFFVDRPGTIREGQRNSGLCLRPYFVIG